MDPAKEAGAPAPDGPTRPIHIPIPPEDCTLVLCNLLLNALQHSPPDSTVDIGLTTNSQTVELVVQDHGEGIPADALPHVFDRFYRGDPSRTRTTGGTGLGLAIVKAIVQKAGGKIALTSQPDPSASGHGATAILHLPLSE
jgi:signal transduction histidine kinase